MKLETVIESLKTKLTNSYTEGISIEEAEKLAGEFLSVMWLTSDALEVSGLDARMRKAGLKAIRAAVYLDACKASDKKPSDVWLENFVTSDKLVTEEQRGFDESEERRNKLERDYEILNQGHIYFRQQSRGTNG